jgi:nitrate reductase gamma subunit
MKKEKKEAVWVDKSQLFKVRQLCEKAKITWYSNVFHLDLASVIIGATAIIVVVVLVSLGS